MRQLAKLLSRFDGSEGSNPSLSAIPYALFLAVGGPLLAHLSTLRR
jgi:hypothetical protein